MTNIMGVFSRPVGKNEVSPVLGEVYNARTGKIQKSISLWDDKALEKYVHEPEVQKKNFVGKFVLNEELDQLQASLDVKGSLKLEYKIGSVKGSGRYMVESTKNKFIEEVRYVARVVTGERQLRGVGSDIMSGANEMGTHFVSGMTLGASCVFVFSRRITESSSSKDVSGKLKGELMKMVKGSIDLSKKEDEESYERQISFVVDFDGEVENLPVSLSEAVEFIKNAQKNLQASKTPISITLTPIGSIPGIKQKLLAYDIEMRTIEAVEDQLDRINSIQSILNTSKHAASANNLVSVFDGWTWRFDNANTKTNLIFLEFQKTLYEALVEAKSNENSSSLMDALQNLLQTYDNEISGLQRHADELLNEILDFKLLISVDGIDLMVHEEVDRRIEESTTRFVVVVRYHSPKDPKKNFQLRDHGWIYRVYKGALEKTLEYNVPPDLIRVSFFVTGKETEETFGVDVEVYDDKNEIVYDKSQNGIRSVPLRPKAAFFLDLLSSLPLSNIIWIFYLEYGIGKTHGLQFHEPSAMVYGDYLVSHRGKCALILQSDCNLVVYPRKSGHLPQHFQSPATWNSVTARVVDADTFQLDPMRPAFGLKPNSLELYISTAPDSFVWSSSDHFTSLDDPPALAENEHGMFRITDDGKIEICRVKDGKSYVYYHS